MKAIAIAANRQLTNSGGWQTIEVEKPQLTNEVVEEVVEK
jgi:hypothetical protein